MLGIFEPEALYAAWINVSIILLTASLVFYHMSKVGSININKRWAAIISCSLILINIVFTINSVIPYYTRSGETLKQKSQFENENVYRMVYLCAGMLFVVVELMICYYFIKDSW